MPGFKKAALRPVPQCRDCLDKLGQEAAELAAGDDPQLRERTREAAREVLDAVMDSGLSSPEIANRVLAEIARLTGDHDPYHELKRREAALALKAFERVRPLLGDDLRSLVSLAALGNSLDFFMPPEESLAEIQGVSARGVDFFRDDIARLDQALAAGPELALYLTDNSGEVFFDLPLYEYIAERAGRLVLVVKGGPALNDLTRRELRAAGLADRFAEVGDTGAAGAGVDWSRTSPEFLGLVGRADLIVSKGMANFETVYPRTLAAAVFFIFKVKCAPIQDHLSAPVGSYLAMWTQGTRAPA
jgi:uncharacterized protein with ATP-grasp and redox domains